MKKFLRKEIFVTVLFLAVIFFFGGMTALKNFPFKPSEVETVYTDGFYDKERFVEVWSLAQRLTSTHRATTIEDAEYGYIIRDTHGKLHFPASHFDVSGETQRTIAFAQKLSSEKTPFLYIQAPNKKLEGYTVYPSGAENYANEDCDVLLAALEESGVDTFDLRESVKECNLDRSEMFYATDHHWTTETAFWAFGEVVEQLNERYNLGIDADGFYRDLDNYTVTEYPNSYLGSLGRRVGSALSGYDDYTFIQPNFDTDYTIYNALVSLENPAYEGDFMTAIVRRYILDSTDKAANKHAAYFEYDYGDLIIKNNLIDNDIKILLIKDSFSLPFAAFLSECVSELHMVDLRDDAAPVPSEYVEKYDFDCVLVMYNPEVFGTKMFNFGA